MEHTESIRTGKVIMRSHTGIDLHISSLSYLARQQILKQALELHPLPNPKDYERQRDAESPIFGGSTADPGVISADDNPDYRDAKKEALEAQEKYINDTVLTICVSTPQRATLLDLYKEEVTRLRQYAYDTPLDDWAVLVKCFLCSIEDLRDVVYPAINQTLPLSNEEVTDAGTSFFRHDVQRAAAHGSRAAKEPSHLLPTKPDSA